jgi:hypothetical protein
MTSNLSIQYKKRTRQGWKIAYHKAFKDLKRLKEEEGNG